MRRLHPVPSLFAVLTVLAVWSVLSLLPCLRAAEPVRAVPGITEPFLDVMLSSSVPGILTARKFQEGDFVKEGDVLVELDKKLEELEVTRRQLVADLRKVDLDSTRVLFQKTSSVAKEELEKKEVDYKVAVVEHAAAVEQLRRRQILAPFSGYITELLHDPGEACQPYEPLVHLVDTARCYFIANVEAKVGATLKLNQTTRLQIDTGTDPAQVRGKIVFLSPVVDPASGLMRVKVLFDNPQSQLRPGLAGQLLLEPYAD